MGTTIDTATHEPSYIAGRNAALRRAILTMARDLLTFAPGDDATKLAFLIEERASVQRGLRQMFELLECEDWDEDLHLGDVVEKTLLPALKLSLEEAASSASGKVRT